MEVVSVATAEELLRTDTKRNPTRARTPGADVLGVTRGNVSVAC
jgi:hypothetical protein